MEDLSGGIEGKLEQALCFGVDGRKVGWGVPLSRADGLSRDQTSILCSGLLSSESTFCSWILLQGAGAFGHSTADPTGGQHRAQLGLGMPCVAVLPGGRVCGG